MYPCTFKFNEPAVRPRVPFREAVVNLEQALFEFNGGGDGLEDFPLKHHFAPKVYGREMLIPAGGTIVGKIHRHAHLNIVVRGRAKVATEFGDKVVIGGDVFVSQPGVKRAVHALEETVWITIHPNETDKQDRTEVEDYVIAPSYAALGFDQKEVLK